MQQLLEGGLLKLGNSKAEMFNNKASNPKNKSDEVLKALELQREQNVADIGSGGDYFALRFAEAVGPEGRVFAVDTDHNFLDFVQESAKEKGLANVETVLAAKDGVVLPEKSLNLIFMRNVCHHLPDRTDYFRKLKAALKPEGRIAVVEYRGGGFSFHALFGHYVSKETIIKEMEQARFQMEDDLGFLPELSFTVFQVKQA